MFKRKTLFATLGVLFFLLFSFPPALAQDSPFSYYPPGPTGNLAVSQPLLNCQLVLASDQTNQLTFTMTLDGVNVPATLTPNQAIIYKPPHPLAQGSHSASLHMSLGNWVADESWSFIVLPGALATLPAPGTDQGTALQAVNAYRASLNLPPVTLDDSLDLAAQAQANFYLTNASRYDQSGLSVHNQDPSWPGYFGKEPWDRDGYYGYPGGQTAEDQAFTANPAEAVSWWVDSVYHRFPIIDPTVATMGFGVVPLTANDPNGNGASYLDLGYFGSPSVPDSTAIPYPANGQMNVPTDFQAGETPDPLAAFPGATYPSGYPITFFFPSTNVTAVTATSATLTTSDGTTVPSYLLTPQNDPAASDLGTAVAVIPKAPLAANTYYQVSLQGTYTLNNATPIPYTKTWSFSTATLPALTPAPTDRVILNGKPLSFPVPPAVANGRILVPFRTAFEDLGAQVNWDPSYPNRATADFNGHHVEIDFGNYVATVDGQEVTLDSPPQVVAGSSLVPLRFAAQSLGLNVTWDANTNTVYLIN